MTLQRNREIAARAADSLGADGGCASTPTAPAIANSSSGRRGANETDYAGGGVSGRAPLDLDATQHPLLEPVAHFGMKVGTAGNNDPARQKTPSTGTVFLTNKRRKFIYEWVREGFTVPRFEYGETNRLILHKPGVDHLSIGVLTDSDRERFDALAVLVLHFVQTVANPEMVREVVL